MDKDKTKNKNNYDSEDSASEYEEEDNSKDHKRAVVCVNRNGNPLSSIQKSKLFDNIEEASDDSSQDRKSELKSTSKLSKSQCCDPHIKFYVHSNKNNDRQKCKLKTTNLSGIAKILSMKNKMKDKFYSRSKRNNNHPNRNYVKSVSPVPYAGLHGKEEQLRPIVGSDSKHHNRREKSQRNSKKSKHSSRCSTSRR